MHKSDGRLLEAEDAGETPVADTAVAMYYDVRSRALHFPALEPGDVVELDYRTSPTASRNPYGDYFGNLLLFRTAMPTAMKRYVLVTPSSREIHVRKLRMARPATVRQSANERVYQWDAENILALPNEPRAPAVTSFAPYCTRFHSRRLPGTRPLVHRTAASAARTRCHLARHRHSHRTR